MFTVKILTLEEAKNYLRIFKNISCLRLRDEFLKAADDFIEFKNISCLRLRELL